MTTETMTVPWEGRVLTTAQPGEPEWLKAHEKVLGGHDVACILGQGRKTPLQLWAELTGKLPREDISKLPWVRRGQALEPVVCALYAEENPTRRLLPSPGLVRHAELPFLAGTPDRLLLDPERPLGVLEAKTFGFWKRADWKEGIPLPYQVQVQVYLAVLGLDWASIAAMPVDDTKDDTAPVLCMDIVPEPTFIAFMLEEVERFWVEHVEADIPPPALQDDTSVLRRMFKRESPGTVIRLNDIHDGLWQERKRLLEEKKAIEARCEEIAATIQQEMGVAEWAEMPSGGVLRWRVEPRKEYVVKASEPRVLREMGAIK